MDTGEFLNKSNASFDLFINSVVFIRYSFDVSIFYVKNCHDFFKLIKIFSQQNSNQVKGVFFDFE